LWVLVANLQDRNRAYAQVLDFVKAENSDLALFIEVDSAWVQRFDEQLTDLPYTAGVGNLRSQIQNSRWVLASPVVGVVRR
jgi:hypothetical protein